jgi:hypothetical protein
VAIGISLLVSQGSLASQSKLPLTLRVYDTAGVPAKALDEAKTQLRRIFNSAGVAPLWLDCVVAQALDPACVGKLQPTEIVVRIPPRTSTSRTGHLLGAALVMPDGFGHYATIFYGEVRIRAEGDEKFEGRILGYAIAHEVGHLLLGEQIHAPTGIMIADLAARKVRAKPKQFFLFTSSEAEQVRTNLKARILATTASSELPVSLIE